MWEELAEAVGVFGDVFGQAVAPAVEEDNCGIRVLTLLLLFGFDGFTWSGEDLVGEGGEAWEGGAFRRHCCLAEMSRDEMLSTAMSDFVRENKSILSTVSIRVGSSQLVFVQSSLAMFRKHEPALVLVPIDLYTHRARHHRSPVEKV